MTANDTEKDQGEREIQKLLVSVLRKDGGERKKNARQTVIQRQLVIGFGIDVLTKCAKAGGEENGTKHKKCGDSAFDHVSVFSRFFPVEIGKANEDGKGEGQQDIEIKGADLAEDGLLGNVDRLASDSEKKDLQKISQLIRGISTAFRNKKGKKRHGKSADITEPFHLRQEQKTDMVDEHRQTRNNLESGAVQKISPLWKVL